LTRKPGDLPLIVQTCHVQETDTATGRRGERHAVERQVKTVSAFRILPRPSFQSTGPADKPVAH